MTVIFLVHLEDLEVEAPMAAAIAQKAAGAVVAILEEQEETLISTTVGVEVVPTIPD